MSTRFDFARAAAILRFHRRAGTRLAALPEDLRPRSRAEGYAVQAHWGKDADLFGWKIAATSAAGQAHIGVSGPLAGRIFADTVVPDGGACSLAANTMRLAEPEFAFRFGRDLAPQSKPRSPEEVLDAVTTLHPAIELPDSRYKDVVHAGEAAIIADNACAHGFVLGPPAPDGWRRLDLAALRLSAQVGARYSREGVGAAVLGDPRAALAWLVNEMSSLGLTLRAGAVVTTGTCCQPLDLEPGDGVHVDFGPVGSVSVMLTD